MAPRFELQRSLRATRLRVTVRPGGLVRVVAPPKLDLREIERFLEEKASWIERTVLRMRNLQTLPRGKRQYHLHRESARHFVCERVQYWNSQLGYTYGRVSIKNTSSLWGSCSRAGNLNFSFKLLFLPSELADYVVVHELCHLQEHNHSPAFWKLVATLLPDYEKRRKKLRSFVLR